MIYYGTRISENMSIRNPEGYLICKDVPIARTGSQKYLASELGLEGDSSRLIEVQRPEEEVFSPACIASFEGMPFVDGHPERGVDTDNISYLQKGHVQNIRRGTGIHMNELVGDIIVTDPFVIHEIQNGKREISCGYDFMLDDSEEEYTQRQIRGNHIALVDQGRAGHSVCIHDSKPNMEGEKKTMAKRNTILSRMFAAFAKDADTTPEDIAEAADEIQAIAEQANEQPVVAEDKNHSCDEEPEVVEQPKVVENAEDEDDKMDMILDLLKKLVEKKETVPDEAPVAVPEDKLAQFTKDLDNVKKALEGEAEEVADEDMASLNELEKNVESEEPVGPAEFEDKTVDPEKLNEQDEEPDVPMVNVPDEVTYPDENAEPEMAEDNEFMQENNNSDFIAADEDEEEEEEDDEEVKAAMLTAKAATDSAIRMAIRAVKPYIASLPKAQRKAAADSITAELRKQMGKDAKARRNDYTALIKAKRSAADKAAVKNDPRELGKRIMAARNVNYKK